MSDPTRSGPMPSTHLQPPEAPAASAPSSLAADTSLASGPAEQATAKLPRLPDIPGYQILQKLSEGGMGVVYKARQERLDRVVALKIIRPDRMAHPDAVKRFRREAQAVARLLHPNVVVVYDADQAGDLHFLAMEFIDGIDLKSLIEAAGPMSWHMACECVRQAAAGLQHAFEKGLIHRDIKPANLMVSGLPAEWRAAPSAGAAPVPRAWPQPAGLSVKLLDLGLARMCSAEEDDASMSTLTRDGGVVGTPDFMAPEQACDPHAADIRADLYSLGCTLHFLLAGKPPFSAGTLLQKLDQHRWKAPPSLATKRPDVPPALVDLTLKLLAKRPEERLATPRELAERLEALLQKGGAATASAVARPPSSVLKSGQFAPITPPPPATPKLACAKRWTGHYEGLTALAVSADGQRLFTASQDLSVRVWDRHGRELARLIGAKEKICCLAPAPDGRSLLVGGHESGIALWDLARIAVVRRFQGHAGGVRALAWLPDGASFLSAGADRVIRQWAAATGKEQRTFSKHGGEVYALALAPSGKQFASGSWDKSIHLWDLKTGGVVRSFGGPYAEHQWCCVLAVAFTPDGKQLLSGGTDDTLWVWDAATGRQLHRCRGHEGWITAIAVHPEGRLAATASKDRTLRLWDLKQGEALAVLEGHADQVTAAAWSPEGVLYSASADKTVGVWELPTG